MVNFKYQAKTKQDRILKILLVASIIWFPLSWIVNPGWYSILVFINPLSLLLAFIPLIIFKVVNTQNSKVVALPRELFIMQVIFFILWFLLWCFVVNGGDSGSMQSLFSRALGGIFGYSQLVALSKSLFICTAVALSMLTLFMVSYRFLGASGRKSWWHIIGSILVGVNIVYIFAPFFASFVLGLSSNVSGIGGVIGGVNIVYLSLYIASRNKLEPNVWLGIAAVTALSLAYIFRAFIES